MGVGGGGMGVGVGSGHDSRIGGFSAPGAGDSQSPCGETVDVSDSPTGGRTDVRADSAAGGTPDYHGDAHAMRRRRGAHTRGPDPKLDQASRYMLPRLAPRAGAHAQRGAAPPSRFEPHGAFRVIHNIRASGPASGGMTLTISDQASASKERKERTPAHRSAPLPAATPAGQQPSTGASVSPTIPDLTPYQARVSPGGADAAAISPASDSALISAAPPPPTVVRIAHPRQRAHRLPPMRSPQALDDVLAGHSNSLPSCAVVELAAACGAMPTEHVVAEASGRHVVVSQAEVQDALATNRAKYFHYRPSGGRPGGWLGPDAPLRQPDHNRTSKGGFPPLYMTAPTKILY